MVVLNSIFSELNMVLFYRELSGAKADKIKKIENIGQ